MRQLICRRTCEWLEIGYTYRAVRISYLVHLAEVAHIHTGYCKITTCYRARPDKRAQRVTWAPRNAQRANVGPAGLGSMVNVIALKTATLVLSRG